MNLTDHFTSSRPAVAVFTLLVSTLAATASFAAHRIDAERSDSGSLPSPPSVESSAGTPVSTEAAAAGAPTLRSLLPA